MASSRVMRKSSRNSSPAVRSTRSSVAPESIHVQQKGKETPNDEWDDARARATASEIDVDASTPTPGPESAASPEASTGQRVKLRVKEWRPPGSESREFLRDNGAGGQGALATFSTTGKEPASRFKRRPSPVRGLEDRPTRQNSSRRSTAEQVASHESPTSARSAGIGEPSELVSPTGMNGRPIPSSATREGREAFRNIVEAAVERSRVLGNELLGLALRRLFEESFYNKRLAHLLDAVLAQRPTPEEAHEFQAHVKAARKKIKAENPQASSGVPEPDSKPSTPIVAQAPPTPTPKSATTKSPSKRPQRASARNATAPSEHASRLLTRTRANGRAHDSGNNDGQPPAKRPRRSGSVSSTSSLSSAHSYELENDLKEVEDISLAAKNRGMPGARLISSAKGLSAPRRPGAGQSSKRPIDEETIDQERADKKRRLAKTFTDYRVDSSHLRDETRPTPRPGGSTVTYGEVEPTSPASSQGDFLVPPPPGALRTRASRGATPTALGRPRKDAVRKTARIKVSPMKKKNVANTATPGSRMLRERDSYPTPSQLSQSQSQSQLQREASVDGSDSNDGDNQDYCSACNGSGELLCCDGCVRSFHFQCLDPPGDPLAPPEGEWYCHVCVAKRDPQVRPPRGLFALLQHRLYRQNPRAFELPFKIRDYFEGVKTGEDGEYEEANLAAKPKPLRGIGYDDHAQDNTKLKDTKGKIILCFACSRSAEGKREIIACDHCSLKWHLDCLDPPLANAPLKDPLNQNRPRYAWMCPAHAPEELESLGRGGRVHKLRRPKNARIVDPQLRRGFKNDGIIEIENDPSDVEDEVEDGVIYRVTEKSIKLDFIDRIHRMREAQAERSVKLQRDSERRLARESAAAERAHRAFNARSLIDQSAALSLAQLAQADPSIELEGDQVHHLVTELLANAPEAVLSQLHDAGQPAVKVEGEVEAYAKTSSGSSLDSGDKITLSAPHTKHTYPAEERRRQLLLLNELIRRQLREGAPDEEVPEVEGE